MSIGFSQPRPGYPDRTHRKRVMKHGRVIAVPWGNVDVVIDDNQQCPVCLQYSVFPIFTMRANESDYGQPASHGIVPGANLLQDDRDDLFDTPLYKRNSELSLNRYSQDARTMMECLNTRCPNRDTGLRYRQSKVLEDVFLG